ncbi:uncharacterized protein CLUP02_16121 [Colletotrichum lupini]|uniref:Uncharacterized protein n=1 Tax=Colletotrichum lupini TaxID=145971 RepID=A0A9Q8WPD2_9PEZI|nr:uncharacterized protein CLUP02_16121 [Colletotrichum lupini]UQC90591.1 hypothetical protein CLUP02_16121 [Colletotrichum lupini]
MPVLHPSGLVDTQSPMYAKFGYSRQCKAAVTTLRYNLLCSKVRYGSKGIQQIQNHDKFQVLYDFFVPTGITCSGNCGPYNFINVTPCEVHTVPTEKVAGGASAQGLCNSIAYHGCGGQRGGGNGVTATLLCVAGPSFIFLAIQLFVLANNYRNFGTLSGFYIDFCVGGFGHHPTGSDVVSIDAKSTFRARLTAGVWSPELYCTALLSVISVPIYLDPSTNSKFLNQRSDCIALARRLVTSHFKPKMRFLIFVAHAGLAIAATAPGCHFWVREISTGQNVGQGCVGKGWTTYPWAAKARVGVTADHSMANASQLYKANKIQSASKQRRKMTPVKERLYGDEGLLFTSTIYYMLCKVVTVGIANNMVND